MPQLMMHSIHIYKLLLSATSHNALHNGTQQHSIKMCSMSSKYFRRLVDRIGKYHRIFKFIQRQYIFTWSIIVIKLNKHKADDDDGDITWFDIFGHWFFMFALFLFLSCLIWMALGCYSHDSFSVCGAMRFWFIYAVADAENVTAIFFFILLQSDNWLALDKSWIMLVGRTIIAFDDFFVVPRADLYSLFKAQNAISTLTVCVLWRCDSTSSCVRSAHGFQFSTFAQISHIYIQFSWNARSCRRYMLN